jgi:hypothetical protein
MRLSMPSPALMLAVRATLDEHVKSASTHEEKADQCLLVAQFLETLAEEYRKQREGIVVSPVFTCHQYPEAGIEGCGRQWTVAMTVAQERECRPENCPACYNKTAKHGPSTWTDGFFYV